MSGTALRADELRATLQSVLDRATGAGASAADTVFVEQAACTSGVRLGEPEKLSDAREKRLGLRVFIGERTAVAATADLTSSSLARFTTDLVGLARATAPDPLHGLPAYEQLASEAPDLDLYDDAVEQPSAEAGLERARIAEAAALAVDPRLTNSEGAEFSQATTTVAYASTLGFDGGYRRSSFSLSVMPIASTNGQMQRDYWFTSARHLDRLEEAEAVGRRAAERTLRRLGARKVKTQEAPVVFEAETAVSLMGHLAQAVTGPNLYRGTSFLLGKLGEVVASPLVTVVDDGRLQAGHGSRPFDAEGLATRRTMVVNAGRLESYLLDTYSARRLKLAPTGSATRAVGGAPSPSPTNFYLEAGSHDPADIIASIDRGLLVTELIGFGVNPVTGDYSRGASGLWIENGEVVYPVEEITIAGNLLEMFSSIDMVGNDLVFRGAMASPTVKIPRMTIAGA